MWTLMNTNSEDTVGEVLQIREIRIFNITAMCVNDSVRDARRSITPGMPELRLRHIYVA